MKPIFHLHKMTIEKDENSISISEFLKKVKTRKIIAKKSIGNTEQTLIIEGNVKDKIFYGFIRTSHPPENYDAEKDTEIDNLKTDAKNISYKEEDELFFLIKIKEENLAYVLFEFSIKGPRANIINEILEKYNVGKKIKKQTLYGRKTIKFLRENKDKQLNLMEIRFKKNQETDRIQDSEIEHIIRAGRKTGVEYRLTLFPEKGKTLWETLKMAFGIKNFNELEQIDLLEILRTFSVKITENGHKIKKNILKDMINYELSNDKFWYTTNKKNREEVYKNLKSNLSSLMKEI